MAAKTAVGKGVALSQPAAGTIKMGAPDTSTVGIAPSKKSKKSNDAIDRKESSPASEIVSIADFNRTFGAAGQGRAERTPYGLYYGALDSVHSITTEDVSYVISKALENDSAGEWGTIKTTVEADVADADDLVTDLATFLNSLERAELALDFGRSADEDTQNAAEEYLDSKLSSVEVQAGERKFTAKDVLGSLYEDDSNVDCLRKMLSSLRETLTLENESAYKAFIDYASQSKRRVDLNPATLQQEFWDLMRPLGAEEGGVTALAAIGGEHLVACVEILSHILSLSSGIPRVKADTVSSKISLNTSDPGAIFNGTSAWARLEKTRKADGLPFRKTLAAAGSQSVLPALYMVQLDGDDRPIIPVELEDSSKGTKYRSGINALIRDPLLSGEISFAKLSSFVQAFEDSRQNIDTYLELMLGRCDPNNSLTPFGILKIIIKNFVDGLRLAAAEESQRYQLLLIKSGLKNPAVKQGNPEPDQYILRIAGRIKYHRLKNATSTTSGEEVASGPKLMTSKVSEGSESLKDDATPTTTQVEDKSGNNVVRTIRRFASASASSEDLAREIIEEIAVRSDDGPANRESILAAINEEQIQKKAYVMLKNLPDEYITDDFCKSVKKVTGATFTFGLLAEDYRRLYEETLSNIDELQKELESAVPYKGVDTVESYFEECQSMTDGTVMSTIVSAYDEIVNAALARIPSDEKIVDSDGFTKFAGFDEFGLLSLIVECYIFLAHTMSMSAIVDNLYSPTGIRITSMTPTQITRYADDLNSIISDAEDSALFGSSAPSSASTYAWDAAKTCLDRQSRYQNILAFLSAYSSMLADSKDALIASINDLLAGDDRQAALNTPRGRKTLSNLTTQQIVYRRSLLDKYRPDVDYGYLPSRVRYSKFETEALDSLLMSSRFSSRTSENIRLMFIGIPDGVVNNNKRYIDENIGEVNRTGMLEVIIHRNDHELDDLIFKEKVYLFDPQLYLTPGAFDDFTTTRKGGANDALLSIAKLAKFTMYDRDTKEVLQYSSLSSHPRYSQLTASQVEQIAKNTVISYLIETYIYKLTGAIFDETLTLRIDDSTSEAGRAALSTTAGLGLPDLILPAADKIASIFGSDGEVNFLKSDNTLSTGDKELIAALTSSYLMRNDTLVNRVLLPSKFDRAVAVAIDLDDFEVDTAESIKRNGAAASLMLQSLIKQGLLIQDGETAKITPRDPLTGGFSIGSVSCQFSPHTASNESGTLLRVTKEALSLKSTSSNLTKLSSTLSVKNNSSSSRSTKKATNITLKV